MNDGQKVAVAALSRVGETENPWGTNTDGGGFIDQLEAHWRLHAEPWCAMFDSWCYRTAGVDDDGVINPGTGAMCANADAKGLWHTGSVPTGAIMILCGTHTEIAISQRAGGLIDCVGGNVNQGVRKTVRTLGGGWRCIVPPAIIAAPPAPIVMYGFDDPRFVPKRYGPWHDTGAREKAINTLSKDQHRWVRRFRISGKNQYAFEILNPNRWSFGPWADKPTRDQKMHDHAKQVGRPMRPWNQKVQPDDTPGGKVTTGETTN